MRRLLAPLTAAVLLVAMAVVPISAAPGGVARNQVSTTDYTILVLGTYVHNYQVVWNPCDDSIAITGGTPFLSGYYTTETITGSLAGSVISFTSTYDGPHNPGYSWYGSFPVDGGALGGLYTGTVTRGADTITTWANHGDYVSSMGGGEDAAHSCIGMPIVSN